ncbi:MAG: hypothetical protein IPO16_14755 [Saprospiraceae bacterium]|nr:hypothetical protein [Saprospiraceae bacterium]
METTKQTHWKQLTNPNYIGAYSLEDGKDLEVQIITVKRETVKGENGKEDECTVAVLKDQKPMILNATNCKTITKILGTPYVEKWANQRIVLFKSLTKLKGENVECLRVREAKPDTKKPILSDKNPNWSKVIQAVKSGAYSIEDLRIKYEITEKVKEQILNECLKKENEKV